jgi:hypothetical protein
VKAYICKQTKDGAWAVQAQGINGDLVVSVRFTVPTYEEAMGPALELVHDALDNAMQTAGTF